MVRAWRLTEFPPLLRRFERPIEEELLLEPVETVEAPGDGPTAIIQVIDNADNTVFMMNIYDIVHAQWHPIFLT